MSRVAGAWSLMGAGNCPSEIFFFPPHISPGRAVAATTRPVAPVGERLPARPGAGGRGDLRGDFFTLFCPSKRLVSASLRIDVCTMFKKLRTRYPPPPFDCRCCTLSSSRFLRERTFPPARCSKDAARYIFWTRYLSLSHSPFGSLGAEPGNTLGI